MRIDEDLFAGFEASTRDVNEACLLPPELYTSEDWNAFEKEAVFGHSWLCVGRADQVPEPGDWYMFEIADEPLLVVRDQQRQVRVLSAVCQHRGMVVAEGSPAELKARLGGDRVIVGLAPGADGETVRERVADATGLDVRLDPETGHLVVEAGSAGGTGALLAVVRALDAAGTPPSGVQLREPTLDEVFLSLTDRTTTTATAERSSR